MTGTICANCDHFDICHDDNGCGRIINYNTKCRCERYVPTKDIPIMQGPELMFGAQATDLAPYFQDMIKRMMNPNKLTE